MGETESERKVRMAAYQKAYYADPVHKATNLARGKKRYEERNDVILARSKRPDRTNETEVKRKARMDAYFREYRADPAHKAAAFARSKKRYEENKEEIKARANLHAASHREEAAAYRADPIHKARAAEQAKKYQADPVKRAKNAELRRASGSTPQWKIKRREKEMLYRHKHPEAKHREHAKRRELGFVLLNSSFPDSDGHHLDMEHVLYIPRYLHQSVHHNVRTGAGMEKINALAFAWVRGAEQVAA